MDVTTSVTIIITASLASVLFLWWQTKNGLVGTASIVASNAKEAVKPFAEGAKGLTDAVIERLKMKKLEYDALKTQIANLHEELAELRAHKISPTLFQPILQLGLIEVDFDHYSVKKYALKEETEGLFTREWKREYLAGGFQC